MDKFEDLHPDVIDYMVNALMHKRYNKSNSQITLFIPEFRARVVVKRNVSGVLDTYVRRWCPSQNLVDSNILCLEIKQRGWDYTLVSDSRSDIHTITIFNKSREVLGCASAGTAWMAMCVAFLLANGLTAKDAPPTYHDGRMKSV